MRVDSPIAEQRTRYVTIIGTSSIPAQCFDPFYKENERDELYNGERVTRHPDTMPHDNLCLTLVLTLSDSPHPFQRRTRTIFS